MSGPAHACRFRPREGWGAFAPCPPPREALRERRAVRVPRCAECGAEQPARRPRRAVRLEVEAAKPAPPPLPTAESRRVAELLARRAAEGEARSLRAGGVLSALARRGLAASLVEEWLEAFLAAGWLGLGHRLLPAGRRSLERIRVLDAAALAEHAEPGAREARSRAAAEAQRALAGLDHPFAAEVARLAQEEAGVRASPPLLRALTALARHVAAGESLAERVFSARHLGDSKQLARLRARLESLVGPLAQLGIREGGSLVHLGGAGALRIGGGAAGLALDLARLGPHLALSRELLSGELALDLPPGGLFVVENFACFEAACRGEAGPGEPVLVVWSAGYPGRGVRRLVEEAARCGARVRVWADLDLDGVRIARHLAGFAGPGFEAWRMAPSDLRAAPRRIPLPPRAAAAIRSDLDRAPAAPLADTLRALLEEGAWAEQETLLGARGAPAG